MNVTREEAIAWLEGRVSSMREDLHVTHPPAYMHGAIKERQYRLECAEKALEILKEGK